MKYFNIHFRIPFTNSNSKLCTPSLFSDSWSIMINSMLFKYLPNDKSLMHVGFEMTQNKNNVHEKSKDPEVRINDTHFKIKRYVLT